MSLGSIRGIIGNMNIVEHPIIKIPNNNCLIPSKVTTMTFIILIKTLKIVPSPVAKPCIIFPNIYIAKSPFNLIISKILCFSKLL